MFTQLYVKASTLMTEFKNDERGVTAIEYGLIAVATATALIAGFSGAGGIGESLESVFNAIKTALAAAIV
ncbi:pilus assembly protein [Vibrio sp. 10N.286.49.C2]|uniref:Flp family type IVb pilin n=1 Tax=unclassified Vibrio TaxID=2614977 RepID=UPI000C83BF39|nr:MULTISPECIES: Flp family type IVb pilin [unclassified Vibrio]PMH31596.1 pilus assembly protein [Vibrio sp. 10N.286.49.C2]PMH50618.1 pilus assembly protein [Vibrio sp. 10N.286.49.B1]PMH82812.1 pilus assembly protein [Vibrio sp. 10N.286.48.B7]